MTAHTQYPAGQVRKGGKKIVRKIKKGFPVKINTISWKEN